MRSDGCVSVPQSKMGQRSQCQNAGVAINLEMNMM